MNAIEIQNLIYALNQVIHNFGAASIIGFASYGLIRQKSQQVMEHSRSLWFLLGIAWAIQGTSGAIFGATTLHFNGQLPDIHGVAVIALIIKIICVIVGFILSMFVLWLHKKTVRPIPRITWLASLLLGATALSAAAFLRWFS